MPTSPPTVASPGLASAWLGPWSLPQPHDRVTQTALAIGLVLLAGSLIPGGPRWLASLLDFAGVADLGRRRRFVVLSAFAAAFLSLGYIAYYLHGGPRAADAAVYWLQGRALSHGQLAWPAPEPTASFRAPGLLFTPGGRLSGIFPPAYPLLLAAGFLVGAPMLIGPLVAAAVVVVTWLLVHEIATLTGARGAHAEAIARAAVGLSVVSAALRYHTADALPHGAAAAAIALALTCALRARRLSEPRLFGVAGLAVGLLLAGRPTSSVAVGVVVLALALTWGGRERGRGVAWLIAAAIPGLLLLLAANRAATGHAFVSPVSAYLRGVTSSSAVHAGLGVRLLASLHRLRAHALDIANFEPLALLVIAPFVPTAAMAPAAGKARTRAAVACGLVVAGQLLIHAPLLPDDVSPGAGAALFAEVLPIEHALIAIGLAQWFPRALGAAATATLALAVLSFAVHASPDHRRMADGDLGRPHFDPDVLREGSVIHGLVFFDDDRSYELAQNPGVAASHGVEAVRMRGDDHDRLLYDMLGHPPVHRYAAAAASGPEVTFWSPPAVAADSWRFEAESDWPPIAPSGGWTEVVEANLSCASAGHVLALTPSGAGDATVTLEVPAPRGATAGTARTWTVTPRAFQRGGTGTATLVLVDALDAPRGRVLAQWSWTDGTPSTSCLNLPPLPVELGGERSRAWLVMTAHGGPVALDSTTLRAR